MTYFIIQKKLQQDSKLNPKRGTQSEINYEAQYWASQFISQIFYLSSSSATFNAYTCLLLLMIVGRTWLDARKLECIKHRKTIAIKSSNAYFMEVPFCNRKIYSKLWPKSLRSSKGPTVTLVKVRDHIFTIETLRWRQRLKCYINFSI